ncbi:Protein white [Dirofilaria immitis]|nr:Protein white [Dirofilaria immitis]
MVDSSNVDKTSSERTKRKTTTKIHSQDSNQHLRQDESLPLLESAELNNEGKIVTWSDITVKVPLSKKTLTQCLKIAREPRETKTILSGVSGYATPGTTLAIMGSSGTGKTVLLNALTMNVSSDVEVEGKILVNSEQLSSTDMHRISRYVHQDDVFVGTLTVREQLIYSAELQMGHRVSKADRLKRVEEILKELGLKRCETTLIGITNRLKGISCGESKRLAFACEVSSLVLSHFNLYSETCHLLKAKVSKSLLAKTIEAKILTDPPILFCDEPTSGLDSFMAIQVVHCLKDMAKREKQ